MPVARLASDREIVAALPEVFDGAPMMPTRRVVSGLKGLGLRLSAEPEDALTAALRTADRPYYWLAGSLPHHLRVRRWTPWCAGRYGARIFFAHLTRRPSMADPGARRHAGSLGD